MFRVLFRAPLNLLRRHRAEQHQSLVQFIRAGRLGPCFGLDSVNCGRLEHTETVVAVSLRGAPRVNGLSATFFQWRVVEKCVRASIQDFGCQGGWFRQVARDITNFCLLHAAQELFQPVDVHRFGEAIVNCLFDQRMIWNLAVSDDVLQARKLVRKYCRQKIFRFHTLQWRGDFRASTETRHGKRPGGVPPPSNREHRGVKQCLHEQVANGFGIQITKHLIKWK